MLVNKERTRPQGGPQVPRRMIRSHKKHKDHKKEMHSDLCVPCTTDMQLRAISRGFFSNSIETVSLTPIRPYADTPIHWSFLVAALPRCNLCVLCVSEAQAVVTRELLVCLQSQVRQVVSTEPMRSAARRSME